MSATKKLIMIIDKERCSAYGLCADKSSLLKLDENGYSYTESDVVPPNLEVSAREAAAECPMSAISIDEVEVIE
jgi:ferredoxin